MALRRRVGCLGVAGLVMCAWTACKGGDADKGSTNLNRRCEQLSMACGEKDKHVEQLLEECTQAATKQMEKGCKDPVIALYDCYEKELCGSRDKVWTLDDFRVLTERHGKCVAERKALRECVGK